jgi:acyl carrier protein
MKSKHLLLDLIRTELAKSPWKIDPLRIHPTTKLSDLELDSLDLEELLLNLELPLQTDLTQPPKSLATIQDLIAHIQTHLPQ